MNAELLAMLGGAGSVPSRREVEAKTLLSFKAGKMTTEKQDVSIEDLLVSEERKSRTTIISL